jgi:acyl dehydratase
VITWQEGQELPPQTYLVSRADLVAYAEASGDANPIHLDDAFARSVGLPGVIAHGMYTMALAGRALATWAGRPDAVVEYGVRFTRPVVVPAEAPAEVVVAGSVRTVSDGRVSLDLTVTSNGERVLAAARAILRVGD